MGWYSRMIEDRADVDTWIDTQTQIWLSFIALCSLNRSLQTNDAKRSVCESIFVPVLRLLSRILGNASLSAISSANGKMGFLRKVYFTKRCVTMIFQKLRMSGHFSEQKDLSYDDMVTCLKSPEKIGEASSAVCNHRKAAQMSSNYLVEWGGTFPTFFGSVLVWSYQRLLKNVRNFGSQGCCPADHPQE